MSTPAPTSKLPPRARILETADTLFYRDGIRATGIDRIIAESGVAKKTFYRHYPAKADLIVAFVHRHHRNWMLWFSETLKRHGGDLYAVAPTLSELFTEEGYRGCACINAAVELGGAHPEIIEISRQRKRALTSVIRRLLPVSSRTAAADARAMAIAIDGAIVGVQAGDSPESVLRSLARIASALRD